MTLATRLTDPTRPVLLPILAVLFAVVLGAPPMAAQTLPNGSMTGTPPGTYPWNTWAPPGWDNNDTTTDIFDASVDTYGYAWVPSSDGGTFVHALGLAEESLAAEEIWSTITDLVPGNTYSVRFEQTISYGITGWTDVGGFWSVSVAGVVYDGPIMPTPDPGVAVPWTSESFDFTATASEHVLFFRARNVTDNPDINEKARLGLDGVSVTLIQVGQGNPGWNDHPGGGLPGLHGVPLVIATGNLDGVSPDTVSLTKAAENSIAALFVAPSSTPVSFKGGTLLAFPSLPPLLVPTGPLGEIPLTFTLPQGLPSGMELWIQWAIQDHAAVQGVALSNAVQGVTP